MTPKISYIMITARESYPYKSGEHVFQPTLRSFWNQTVKDFEWIIVDALYESRKTYFDNENLVLPCTVKHVPAAPNMWHEKGLPGIAAQYNKGIIHADGELLFFTGDSYMCPPNFIQSLQSTYTATVFPLAWYMRDYGQDIMVPGPDGNTKLEPSVKSPVPYNLSGYTGENVAIEHRYHTAFLAGQHVYDTPWQWYFGCSSASLESMLYINGFDQNFDGDYTLLDCDVGSRLHMLGFSFVLVKDLFLVRIPTDVKKWSAGIKKARIQVKCNYPLVFLNREKKRYRANKEPLSYDDLDWIKYYYCPDVCGVKESCKQYHQDQYPFEYKPNRDLFNFWFENQQIFNLSEERDARIDGEKYVEGVVVDGSS